MNRILHIISHIAARHLSKRGRAIRELERMVEANKRAPATIEFARRRAAAKRGWANKLHSSNGMESGLISVDLGPAKSAEGGNGAGCRSPEAGWSGVRSLAELPKHTRQMGT